MKIFTRSLVVMATLAATYSHAHYPFVAPLSYQTFNNHTAVIAGFYDNPFASEVAIKNFKFHYHNPEGKKVYLQDDAFSQTQTVSSFSLENKIDGTYRIRGEKQGLTSRFALDGKTWKPLIAAKFDPAKANDKVFYAENLKKNSQVKTVQSLEIIETFVSRRATSNHVIHHLHDGFDVQFISHPNALKAGQAVQFNVLDNKKGVANVGAHILAQTTDFSREQKVLKTVKSNTKGELHFNLEQAGQYLLTIDYQQPLTQKGNQLKRYKYTLAFNVTD
ncbi:DUF4198 domain-containing protein [Acinetobacter sp. B51(2017)]|uniref:DUF4198 domain-containing protein n=1 Tax=Acinetobacter sp. B51(2017) TaxID=2060938 RepID=UPI000F084E41|nr:DUF4198 domain-containing protein [Acinetobacter sp. B51(2017)]